jgi:hypothetical protein
VVEADDFELAQRIHSCVKRVERLKQNFTNDPFCGLAQVGSVCTLVLVL